MIFLTRYSVHPNTVGYLFRDNRLRHILGPGIYHYWNLDGRYAMACIPTAPRIHAIVGQEVLTLDNIALRFSYLVEYEIGDPDAFVAAFDVLQAGFSAFQEADAIVHHFSQVQVRKAIGAISSEELNELQDSLLNEVAPTLRDELLRYGIAIRQQLLRDVTFPRPIQQLFSRKLEAKIRADSDLENARSIVAAARTMKNAAKLMESDDNIRYLQLLETMNKIAQKGNHTFHLHDLPAMRTPGLPART